MIVIGMVVLSFIACKKESVEPIAPIVNNATTEVVIDSSKFVTFDIHLSLNGEIVTWDSNGVRVAKPAPFNPMYIDVYEVYIEEVDGDVVYYTSEQLLLDSISDWSVVVKPKEKLIVNFSGLDTPLKLEYESTANIDYTLGDVGYGIIGFGYTNDN